MSRTRGGVRGMTVVEVLVAAAILGLAAAGLMKGAEIYADADREARRLVERAEALDYVANLLENRDAWRATVQADATLKAYLESTQAVSTTAEPLELRDENDRVVIAGGDAYLDAAFQPVGVAGARWRMVASWSRQPSRTVLVGVTVTTVLAGVESTRDPRVVRKLARSPDGRCVVKTAPIVGNGGGTQWDRGVVACDQPFIRTGLTINPGCGAIGARAQPRLSDDVTAECYQISGPLSAECSSAASLNGVCEVTCCVFD